MKRCLLVSCILSALCTSLHAEKKPNIVFVLVDDQRNTSLGSAGHPQIKTPVIDSLAARGVRFENAFVQTPICMASRANLFTGLTTTTHGYHANPGNPVRKEDLDTSFPTLHRQSGYRTAFYGKQHVNWEKGVNGMPTWFGVRDDRYSYANYYKNGTELLYDRERDPTELTNVAADPAYADVFARLRQCSLDYKKQYTRTATATSDESPPEAPKKKSKKARKDD